MRTIVGILATIGLVTSCVPGETGIDRTSVVGEVHIAPTRTDEGDDDDNKRRPGATVLPPLHYAVTVVEGQIYASVDDGMGMPGANTDEDWLVLNSELSFDADFELRLPGATEDSRVLVEVFDTSIEWEVPASCAADQVACLEGGTDAAECTAAYDECAAPEPGFDKVSERVVSGNKARLQWAFEADVDYVIHFAGIVGEPNQPYNLVLKGADPNDAGVIVGAFPSNDPTARGNPLGGTNAGEFRMGPGWTWQAPFEMLYIRRTDSETCDLKDEDQDGEVDEGLDCAGFIREGELCDGLDNDDDGSTDEGFEDVEQDEEGEPLCGVLTEPRGSTDVDETVTDGFVFAGDWPSLNAGLPAGTWYSEFAIPVTFPAEEVVTTVTLANPVVLDSFAPLVIGFEVDEVEPNDSTADSSVPSLDLESTEIQDIGTLSGPGFVDIIRGAVTYEGNADSWDADVDTFKFQVPEPTTLLFTLDWAEAADIDILIMDADNEVLGLGYFNQPETNEYPDSLYSPGQDYFIGIMIWAAPDDPGTSYAWELGLEQLGG